MFLKYPAYYHQFNCIAGDCPDTCCFGWDVVVDEASAERFQKINNPFGDRLRKAMTIDEEGDTIFKNVDGHCPFLTPYALCEIYQNLGPDALCDTCKLYPRYINDYGCFKEYGLSFSCPEALRMILNDNRPFIFVLEEVPKACDPLSPELQKALDARDTLIRLFNNRSFSIEARLVLALTFGRRLQSLFWSEDPEALKALHADYRDPNTLKEILLKQQTDKDFDDLTAAQTSIYDVLMDCEAYRKDFETLIGYAGWHHLGIEAADYGRFLQTEVPNSSYFEHLIVYYLHRYFLEDAEAGEALTSIQLLSFTFIALKVLLYFKWTIQQEPLTAYEYLQFFYRYSREIEHSLDNMDKVYDALMTQDGLSPEALIRALMVF